jgi:hypothetical protein
MNNTMAVADGDRIAFQGLPFGTPIASLDDPDYFATEAVWLYGTVIRTWGRRIVNVSIAADDGRRFTRLLSSIVPVREW